VIPACFDSEAQYREWRLAAIPTKTLHHDKPYCLDCTQDYQYRMIRERRCENPGFVFDQENDE